VDRDRQALSGKERKDKRGHLTHQAIKGGQNIRFTTLLQSEYQDLKL